MRPWPVLLLLAATRASAQGTSERPLSLFQSVRPQAMVVIRKHSSGVDLVEITMLEAKFPPELLKSAAQRLAAELGQTPRGLDATRVQLAGADASLGYTRATFALNGLVDESGPILRTQPILRAMAGFPAPYTVTGLGLVFENQRASGSVIPYFRSDAVQIEASPETGPIGVEYRIKLLTQDPARIVVPDRPERLSPPLPMPPKTGTDWSLYGLFAAASVAAGALVYSLLIRSRTSRRP